MNNRTDPILYIVIPCYNEQEAECQPAYNQKTHT